MSGLRERIAEALLRWHSANATVCEHTQMISYGEAAAAVMAEVQPELDRQARVEAKVAELRGLLRDHAELTLQEVGKVLHRADIRRPLARDLPETQASSTDTGRTVNAQSRADLGQPGERGPVSDDLRERIYEAGRRQLAQHTGLGLSLPDLWAAAEPELTRLRQRAEQAEAVLERTRALLNAAIAASWAGTPAGDAVRQARAALDQPAKEDQ